MTVPRRTILEGIPVAGLVGFAGCSGSVSCGPADGTTVEELAEEEPTGLTNELDDQVELVGTIATADRAGGETIRIDDTTGLAELEAGPGMAWSPQNIPDDGECISGFGYYVDDDHEAADVVLSDVSISVVD